MEVETKQEEIKRLRKQDVLDYLADLLPNRD